MNSVNGILGHLRDAYAFSPLLPSPEQQQQQQQQTGLHQPPERVPKVVDATKAEQLAQRRSRVQRDNNQEGLDTHARRALQAYQQQAGDSDKDYVSDLLGIDTYA